MFKNVVNKTVGFVRTKIGKAVVGGLAVIGAAGITAAILDHKKDNGQQEAEFEVKAEEPAEEAQAETEAEPEAETTEE